MAEIAIRVRTIGQLFNSFDPSPFHEKDLDDDAEDYMVGWARELPSDQPLSIVVHVPPQEANSPEAAGLAEAMANYFENRARRSSTSCASCSGSDDARWRSARPCW